MNLWPLKSDNCTHWTVLHSLQRTFQWFGENQTAGTASNCATYSPDDHMWPIADFTLCTVTVTVSLTWCECGCGCGNGCHDNSNGDCQDDAGKVWNWFSVDLVNQKVSDGCKRLKVKWDSEAERKIIGIWADIAMTTALRSFSADSDGDSERILYPWCWQFLCSCKWHKAVKWREGRFTKVWCPSISLCVTMKVWLFTVMFHTVNVTVAVIFTVV